LINMKKFENEFFTATGQARAKVSFKGLSVLWFNTGSLCNLSCNSCFMESGPTNDRLSFLNLQDIGPFLDEAQEAADDQVSVGDFLVGLTGGEPFLNPSIIAIVSHILERGFKVLVLTNATRVLDKHRRDLLNLNQQYGDKLSLRVSLDHHDKAIHDEERGAGNFDLTMGELKWLKTERFTVSVGARLFGSEDEALYRENFDKVFKDQGIDLSSSKVDLHLFTEMDAAKESVEVSQSCWQLLKKSPADQMCSHQRMIIKEKNSSTAKVVACTLLPYEEAFELGGSLKEAQKDVYLNHSYCAQFCVLGGSSCASSS